MGGEVNQLRASEGPVRVPKKSLECSDGEMRGIVESEWGHPCDPTLSIIATVNGKKQSAGQVTIPTTETWTDLGKYLLHRERERDRLEIGVGGR